MRVVFFIQFKECKILIIVLYFVSSFTRGIPIRSNSIDPGKIIGNDRECLSKSGDTRRYGTVNNIFYN